ncbi:MAG TPA: sialidase family protein [Actinomycetota bacterium]|nr:sialidase family protein [Actinomycetota bacterium]
MSRRTLLRVPIGMVLLLCGMAQPSSSASAPTALVVRDREAGRHTLPAKPPLQADTAMEPSLAVNSKDPLHAVSVFMAGRSEAGCAQAIGYTVTRDGGQTWTSGNLPGVTLSTGGTYPRAQDPVVAFGPDQIVYAISMLCTDESQNDLGLSVSRNGGRTWEEMKPLPPDKTFPLDDKPWITVDNGTSPGHHKGRLYLVWDQVDPVVALYTDDGGETWHGPSVVFPGVGIGALPIVLPNGDLAVVFKAFYVTEQTATLYMMAVAPGAGSLPTGAPLVFEPATLIARDQGTEQIREQRAAGFVPTAAVDQNTGRIYVAWIDGRFRSDGANDIVLSYSDDGVQWSEPVRVNPGPTDNYVDHFAPWLAVDPEGSLRVAYRTQQEAESPSDYVPFVDTWYVESHDAGATFTRPLRINRHVRTDVRFAAKAQSRAFFGEYNQIAVAGSWTYVPRAEAFPLTAKERRGAIFPPLVHHQRIWVAVVDRDGDKRP